ncbi:MAG: ACT domain-containing protein [Polyangiales bacterium]
MPEQIPTEGIENVSSIDIRFADRFGYVIKPLAIARELSGGHDIRVHPALIPKSDLLANVNGAMNAIHIHASKVGSCLLSGPGAGADPTAASVVADVIDIARNMRADSAHRVPMRSFLPEQLHDIELQDIGELRGRYYLRFSPQDRPGVLAQIAGALGQANVSIQHLVQDVYQTEDPQPYIVMLTHSCRESDVRAALEAIDNGSSMQSKTVALRVES